MPGSRRERPAGAVGGCGLPAGHAVAAGHADCCVVGGSVAADGLAADGGGPGSCGETGGEDSQRALR